MQQNQDKLRVINAMLSEYCTNLLAKINNPNAHINLKMNQCSQKVSIFFDDASHPIRAKFAYAIQKQLRKFLKSYAFDKLNIIIKNKNNDQFNFIDQICDIWQNYQRFVYGLKFILHRTGNTFKDFHRRPNTHENQVLNEQRKDGIDLDYKNQVSPIAVMAVNQLKQFLKINQMIKPLTERFVEHFCNFVRQQRDGTNLPREKINEVLEFFESGHLDYDCEVERVQGKMRIVRKANPTAPPSRKSTANNYFETTFVHKLFDDCMIYYKNWVDTKAMTMNAAEEIKQMLNYLDNQEDRAKFYIHDPKNERKYIEIVQSNLIQYRFQERVCKASGLRHFLFHFELGKADMIEQIKNFWKVVKRVYKKEDKKTTTLGIYENYLKQQATNVSKLTDKAPQFIENAVKLNKKNLQIVQMMGKTLEIDRLRKQILQNMLTMKFANKPNLKQYFGAKHWAVYLNMKLRNKYAKAEKYSETEADLMNLFKLLRCTSIAINEHCKLLNARLLDDVDMSLEIQYSNVLELEYKVLEQIKKQTSENDIKAIQNCLKDIKNSYEERSKQKQDAKLAKFNFYNQLVKKSGNHWVDTSLYDIQPPAILRPCIDALRQQFESSNFAFEFQNGTSLFQGTFGKDVLKFQLKNIYMMILLFLDEKVNKKMFYTDLIKVIKPVGSQRTTNEFIRNLIELQKFGILKTNKPIDDAHVNDIWNWQPSDYLEINTKFVPEKKAPTYKTANLTSLPEYIKKAFANKLSTIEEEQKNMEKDRRARVESRCVQLLKFAQTNDGGKGTITFDQILTELQKTNRQDSVTAMYLKQVLEQLLNKGYCERVQDKRNVFRYIT